VRDIRLAHAAELETMCDPDDRWRRLCELNVAAQVRSVSNNVSVRAAWDQRKALAIHGWIYDLRDGLLRDLNVGIPGPVPFAEGSSAAPQSGTISEISARK
jgi:carbonic anhydrase